MKKYLILLLFLFSSKICFAKNDIYYINYTNTQKNILNYHGIDRIEKYNQMFIFIEYFSNDYKTMKKIYENALEYSKSIDDIDAKLLANLIGINSNFRKESDSIKLKIVLETLDSAIQIKNFYIISKCYLFLYNYVLKYEKDSASIYLKYFEDLILKTKVDPADLYVTKLNNNQISETKFINDYLNSKDDTFYIFYVKINFEAYNINNNTINKSIFSNYNFIKKKIINTNLLNSLKTKTNINKSIQLLISKTKDPAELKTYYAYQLENYLNLNNFDCAFIAFENYNKIDNNSFVLNQEIINNFTNFAKINNKYDNTYEIILNFNKKQTSKPLNLNIFSIHEIIIELYSKNKVNNILFFVNSFLLLTIIIYLFLKFFKTVIKPTKKTK
ncbi:MAG: hypothetical protein ACOVQ2_03870 [Flavobacterium sp.]